MAEPTAAQPAIPRPLLVGSPGRDDARLQFWCDERLRNNEPNHARRLHRRFAAELRLLDDLGWEQEPNAKEFELTMPARELRLVIERVYCCSVASAAARGCTAAARAGTRCLATSAPPAATTAPASSELSPRFRLRSN